jgi:soluble lytic murein transglycosylase
MPAWRSRTWLRAGIGLVLLALAAVTFLFVRGPATWQRRFYPLSYVEAIESSSTRHEVNPYLVASVIKAESDWRPSARSVAGAAGLMQVMPATAEELARRGVVDRDEFPPERLDDPVVGIEYGTAYLRYLVERYHEIEIALAAYNAGLANADTWARQGGDIRDHIEFPETKHFVLKVSRGRERYEELYPDAFGTRRSP